MKLSTQCKLFQFVDSIRRDVFVLGIYKYFSDKDGYAPLLEKFARTTTIVIKHYLKDVV